MISTRLRLSAKDVANFVACQHMTRLDPQEARGALGRPREFDLGFQDGGTAFPVEVSDAH